MSRYIKNFSGKFNNEIDGKADNVPLINSCSQSTDVILFYINIGSSVFTSGDLITITSIINKLGTNNTANIRYWVNTSKSLTNAILIGQTNISATSLFGGVFTRSLYISDHTGGGSGNSIGTQVINSGTTSLTDYEFTTSSTETRPINWDQNIWIISSGSVTNSLDSICMFGLKVYKN